MANSLVKLTLESNQYERGIRQAQKSWADFTRGIGLSASKFTAVSGAIAAVTGALKVAKDAFFQNEQQLDDWGRVCNESKSIYNGFLNALNTGDISGYLSNIDTITKAARDAYNALDELATFNAFNQIQTQKARTGFTEAVAGFRLGEGSKEDVKSAAETLKKELKTRQGLEQEAYLKEIARVAAERGVNEVDLKDALSGTYGDYRKLKEVMPTGKQLVSRAVGQFGATMSYEIPMAQTIQEKMGQALRALNDTELQSLQALGAQAYKTGEEIAQVDKQMARMLNAKAPGTTTTTSGGGRKSGGGGGKTTIDYASDSIAAQEALVQKLTKQWRNASAELRSGYLTQLEDAQFILDSMTGKIKEYGKMEMAQGNTQIGASMLDTSGAGLQIITPLQQMENELANLIEKQKEFGGVSSEVYQMFQEQIDKTQEKIDGFKGNKKKEQDNGKDTTVAGGLSALGQGMNQMASGIEQLGIEVPEGLKSAVNGITAVVSILSGIATILVAIEAITTADALIPFAGGGVARAANGVVAGRTFSGDKIPAMLNAGEVVLNRAQVGNLASQFGDVGLQNLRLETVVTGTQLRFVLNNESQSRGRGQYVTTNFSR